MKNVDDIYITRYFNKTEVLKMSFMFVKYGYGISLRRNINVTVAHEDESFR